jgi:hypothetical protein
MTTPTRTKKPRKKKPPLAPGVSKVMTSQMTSKCKRCRKWIGPGMRIVFTKGAGATHLDDDACAAALPDAPLEAFTDDREAELAVVSQLLEAAQWTFAKTMVDQPHEWTLRKQWADSEAFTRAVNGIRQLGRKRRYRGSTYLTLDVGEWYCGRWNLRTRRLTSSR